MHSLYKILPGKPLSWKLLLCVLSAWAVGISLLWTGSTRPVSQTTFVGSYGDWEVLQGWYRPEPNAYTTIRWSPERAIIRLRAVGGGHGILRLHLVAPSSSRPTRLNLRRSDGDVLSFEVSHQLRRYQILHPLPTGGSDSVLRLQANPYRPTNDPRVLGVGITRISLTGPYRAVVPLRLLLSASLGAVLCTLLVTWLAQNTTLTQFFPLLALGGLGILAYLERTAALQIITLFPWVALGLTLCALLFRRIFGAEAARPSFVVGLAFAAAVVFRFWNLQWDGGGLYHPDEWVFNEAARNLKPPWHPVFFIYGSFPMYVRHATAALLSAIGDGSWLSDPARFILIGRTYSVLASSLTIIILALLAKRWQGSSTAIWSSLLLAGVVLAIQSAHFGTADSLLTLQATLLAYFSLNYVLQGQRRSIVAAGVVLGVGLATKVPALSFGIFPATALLLRAWLSRRDAPQAWKGCLVNAGILLLLTAVSCVVCSPYYVLDWQGFMQAMAFEGATAVGMSDYTYQFIGTIPYIYVVRNALLTMGPPLVVLGFIAWGWLLVHAVRYREPAILLLLSWPTIYFLFFGGIFIKFIRYMLPLVPFLCLYAAALLSRLARRGTWSRRLSLAAGGTAVLITLAYATIYVAGVYGQADPRQKASYWIYQHAPPGSVILREEHGVQPLRPFQEPGNPYTELLGPYRYKTDILRIYAPGTRDSLSYYARTLSNADYLIISSRRHHVTFRRLPDHFPIRACFYRQLFAGNLSYKIVRKFTRGPRLGSWRIDGEHEPWIEQTFQVFDHPTVLIFARTEPIRPTELQQVLASHCRIE